MGLADCVLMDHSQRFLLSSIVCLRAFSQSGLNELHCVNSVHLTAEPFEAGSRVVLRERRVNGNVA